MSSTIQVDKITDIGGNTMLESNGSGTITGLPASAISSGTIATARLGSGTASSSTFLRGDQTYAAAGKINQVLQTLNTSSGNQNTTSTSPGATAVAASITPTSTSSKILVNFEFNFLQNDPQYTSQFYIYRGGSSIYQKSDYHSSDTNQQRRIMNLMYLDSPSSTSSVAYTLYTAVSSASGYLRILAGTGFDSANIILQEVLA